MTFSAGKGMTMPNRDEAAVERMARAICASDWLDPNALRPDGKPNWAPYSDNAKAAWIEAAISPLPRAVLRRAIGELMGADEPVPSYMHLFNREVVKIWRDTLKLRLAELDAEARDGI